MRSNSIKKVDRPSLVLIYFIYSSDLTRPPLNLDCVGVFSEHSPLCVLSHIDRCRLQRELSVHRVFGEYHLCTSCIMWGRERNLVALLLAYTLEEDVALRMTISQTVCIGIEYPYGTCDQILLPVGMLLSEICGLVSVGRPLWQEDESVFCSVITLRSESRRTRNRTLLSHLRPPPTWRARFTYLYPPGIRWPTFSPCRPKRRLMRTYFWINLFTSYRKYSKLAYRI
jgi:hypothetical protein